MDLVHATDQVGELTTEDWLRLEWETCRVDFKYWLRNHGVIVEEDTGRTLIGIETWEKKEQDDYHDQDDFIDALLRGDNVIVGKARQLGLSWIVENYEYWQLEFHSNIRMAIIHRTDPEAMEHLERIKLIQLNQKPWIARKKIRHGRDSKHIFALGDRKTYSIITAHPCTEGVGRGISARIIHLEEMAFWPANLVEKVFSGLRATAGDAGRQIIIVSTANGPGHRDKESDKVVGNFYAALWNSALEGLGSFVWIFLPCFLHPERDQAWRDVMIQDLGLRLTQQEYPTTPGEMFVRSTGAIYPMFSRSQHVKRTTQIPDVPITIQFDWGYENPMCMLIGQWYGSDQLQVLEEMYESGLTPRKFITEVLGRLERRGLYFTEDVVERIIDDARARAMYDVHDHFNTAYGDPSGAAEIASLSEYGIWFTSVTATGGKINSVVNGIRAVQRLMERPGGLIIDPSCSNLIRQLDSYVWKPNTIEEQPLKKEDHAPDTLRYGVYGQLGDSRKRWVFGDIEV